MSDGVRFRERLRQSRAALRQTIADAGAAAAAPIQDTAARFQPGDRVFDLVSGEEVTVAGYARQHIVVPAPERRNG